MNDFFIEWERTPLEEVSSRKSAHFFALERDGEILYLGLAYQLNFNDELNECMEVFNLNRENINVWSGMIIQNIHNIVNRHLAEEVLCLMVNNMKTRFNILCKESYYGREGLTVHNRGCTLMPPFAKTRKQLVRLAG